MAPPSSSSTTANQAKSADITVYGATSFVAKHVLRYLTEAIAQEERNDNIRVTLGGRNEGKLQAVQAQFPSAEFDIFVASGSDLPLLKQMVARTKVVINCAGPFSQYSNMVVQACAEEGTDYVDITGEGYWSAVMRQKHGEAAQKSNARIISMCGYDSIPSDLVVFAAVQALKEQVGQGNVQIHEIKIWHQALGIANGGTIHTAIDYQWDAWNDFAKKEQNKLALRKVPFFVGDPLLLTHPKTVRHNPKYETTRNSFAWGEWLNELVSIDPNFWFGVSLPMPMAPINMKVLQASAVALKYGSEQLQIRERFLPLGFFWTKVFSIFALFPMICIQVCMALGAAFFRLPKIGKAVADAVAPPGSGAPDWMVTNGNCAVYAEVTASSTNGGGDRVNRGYAHMSFQGDPGNAVTAQCVCESALTLLLERDSLPPKSIDGFGTPAELLGAALLNRFKKTPVRPIKLNSTAKQGVPKNERKVYL